MNKEECERIDKKIKISVEFNREISKLINLTHTKFRGNLEIDRLKRLVKLGKEADPLILIENCMEYLLKFKDEINSEKDTFFLEYDFDTMYNQAETEDKQFIQRIINLFKIKYREFSDPEKQIIWQTLKNMLCCIIEYKTTYPGNI
jgi:hypothetical protein